VGGAEAVLAEAAHGFGRRGWDVEILTTCATDHYSWENRYPVGVTEEGPVRVRRFRAVVERHARERQRIDSMILAGQAVAIQDQQLWMNGGVRVPDLWHHVLDNAHRYRSIVVGPYQSWTGFACAQIEPAKTLVMPCLHDEPAAHLPLFSPMFSGAAGIWFLSDPERDLARRLFPVIARHEVVGSGVAVPQTHDPESFRRHYSIEGPFAFYAGRRERGKGWDELMTSFAFAASQGIGLGLVTAGVGDPAIPAALAGTVVDVGFLSDEMRNGAMAAASVYVQPSAMESFSRTAMEAWLAGTPVITTARSEVVRWHVERSQAGLTYRNPTELIECLRFVDERPGAAAALARSGSEYVRTNYDPERVLDRLESTVLAWTPPVESAPSGSGSAA
jgi:glycosyltransferase involved in cell wall biosynthesis